MIRTDFAAVSAGILVALWAGAAVPQTAPPPRPEGLRAPIEEIEAAAAQLAPAIDDALDEADGDAIPSDDDAPDTAGVEAAAPAGDTAASDADAVQGPPVPPSQTRRRVKPRDPTRGQVTNLPLPRYVSLKTSEGNARRGPGLSHRIDWVFKRAGMPLKVTGEYEHWRRVEDADGLGGWVNFALLSGVRTVVVTQDMAEFRARPDDGSEVVYQAEVGVVGRILECLPDWCRVNVEGEKGWARKSTFWGADPGEVID